MVGRIRATQWVRRARARWQYARAIRAGERVRAGALTLTEHLPTISVVTASLNHARFLEQCIQSVLEQGYPRLEYLIIDGGSTDGSVDIVRRYEKHLAFWSSAPDHGQADALNKGFQRVTGELVAWLNADDYYLPGALFGAARARRLCPDAAFYFGDGFRVDEAGAAAARFSPSRPLAFDREALLFGLNFILQPATFICRERLAEVGYLDPDLHYGLDTDLWLRLASLAPVVAVPGFLAASREYATTKTSTGSFVRVEELRRIAERHAGVPMTPGVLCYFLDTVDRLASERTDLFPPPFRRRLRALWRSTLKLLRRHGAGSDGFPLVKRPSLSPARR